MRSSVLPFMAITLVAAGCAGRPLVKATLNDVAYPFEPLAPARAPVAEPARLVESEKSLPVGFLPAIQPGGPPRVREGYPSAEDPHIVLGRLTIALPPEQEFPYDYKRQRESRDARHALEATARYHILEVAAEHGANALYKPSAGAGYWAIHISTSAPPPQADPEEVLRTLVPAGFREIARTTWKLETGSGSLQIPAQHGHCYGLGIALTPIARRARSGSWSGVWKSSMVSYAHDLRPTEHKKRLFDEGFDGVSERGIYTQLFCALVDEPVTLQLSASGLLKDGRDLGSGDVTVVLYNQTLSAAEATEVYCDACSPKEMGCGGVDRGVCARAVACLQLFKTTAAQCKK
jgi:hypothetical protein